MNLIKMALEGDESNGWVWHVWVDDLELFRTEPLAQDDLGSALFSIQRDPARRNPFFLDVPDEELFLVLEGFFFGVLHDALQASAEEQVWAKHLVSPSIPVAVWSRMYLVGCRGDEERLLVWRDGKRRSFILPEGDFDRALKLIIERLSSPGGV